MFSALIVDDEKLAREAIKLLVNWEDACIDTVYEASDGKDALKIIKEHNVDIIITDIIMPHMDGLSFLEEMAQAGFNGQTIVISSYEKIQYYKKAIKLHVSDYVLKPIDEEEINAIVVKAVERCINRDFIPIQAQQKKNKSYEICEYLQEHFMEEISLENLSKRFLISKEHLARVFKSEMNCSILQYVLDLRIRKTEQLLLETDLSNTEIASATGFTDVAYFNKCFKKRIKLTPREYVKIYERSYKKLHDEMADSP